MNVPRKHKGTVVGVGLSPTSLKKLLFIHFDERSGVAGYDRSNTNKHIKLIKRANLRLSLKRRLKDVLSDPRCRVDAYG